MNALFDQFLSPRQSQFHPSSRATGQKTEINGSLLLWLEDFLCQQHFSECTLTTVGLHYGY